MNPLNELILRAKIKKFEETKNALEFADWVNKNITPEYLNPPSYDKDIKDDQKYICWRQSLLWL